MWLWRSWCDVHGMAVWWVVCRCCRDVNVTWMWGGARTRRRCAAQVGSHHASQHGSYVGAALDPLSDYVIVLLPQLQLDLHVPILVISHVFLLHVRVQIYVFVAVVVVCVVCVFSSWHQHRGA